MYGVAWSWPASDERRRYADSERGRRAARTPVGDARRRTRAVGTSGSPFMAESLVREEFVLVSEGVIGRSNELVGWCAPVLNEVRCRRRWPWSDFGSVGSLISCTFRNGIRMLGLTLRVEL